MHPFAIGNYRSGCDCGFGLHLSTGDRFVYAIDMRTGVADEFLHDGDAFVTWDDSLFGTIKWNYMWPDTDVGHYYMKRHRSILGLE
jgi:hypothetical protein